MVRCDDRLHRVAGRSSARRNAGRKYRPIPSDSAKLSSGLAHEIDLIMAMVNRSDANEGAAMDQQTGGIGPAATVFERVADFVLRRPAASFPPEVLQAAAIQFLDTMGIAIAAALRRWSADPVRRFLHTAAALVAMSLVPPLTSGAAAATGVCLVVLHLVVASVMVPALTRALRDRS